MRKILFHPGTRDAAASLGLLVLRVAIGVMMLAGHGYSKLTGFTDMSGSFSDPLGIGSELSLAGAVAGEFFASALVVLELGTRWAAVGVVFTMAVAAFLFHADDPWGKKELAVLYAVSFLTLVVTGAGRFSLDAVLSRPKA